MQCPVRIRRAPAQPVRRARHRKGFGMGVCMREATRPGCGEGGTHTSGYIFFQAINRTYCLSYIMSDNVALSFVVLQDAQPAFPAGKSTTMRACQPQRDITAVVIGVIQTFWAPERTLRKVSEPATFSASCLSRAPRAFLCLFWKNALFECHEIQRPGSSSRFRR